MKKFFHTPNCVQPMPLNDDTPLMLEDGTLLYPDQVPLHTDCSRYVGGIWIQGTVRGPVDRAYTVTFGTHLSSWNARRVLTNLLELARQNGDITEYELKEIATQLSPEP